jgi:o-succinylbenzoate synthase
VHRLALRTERHSSPRPHLRVDVTDTHGRTGSGECSPLPGFSRDDAIQGEAALARAASGLDAIDEDAPADAAIAGALLACALEHVPSARFALETALLDLLGQQRGVSVGALLGGVNPRTSVATNALLVAAPAATLATRAGALAAVGFGALKIKLRAHDEAGFAEELTALMRVRERLPLPFEIRLDPNAAWSLAVAERRLRALAPIAPRYVEQPVAAALLPELGEQAVPWAADESLQSPALVDALIAAGGCAAFILKPAILGGTLRARAIAERAAARGIAVVVTHFCDGPLAMAAGAELAVALAAPPLACGLAPHEQLAAFAAAQGGLDAPQLADATRVRSSGGPGLLVRPRSPR